MTYHDTPPPGGPERAEDARWLDSLPWARGSCVGCMAVDTPVTTAAHIPADSGPGHDLTLCRRCIAGQLRTARRDAARAGLPFHPSDLTTRNSTLARALTHHDDPEPHDRTERS